MNRWGNAITLMASVIMTMPAHSVQYYMTIHAEGIQGNFIEQQAQEKAWENFMAQEDEFKHDDTWDYARVYGYQAENNISTLPDELYPNPNPKKDILVQHIDWPGLDHIDSLISIETIGGRLDLYRSGTKNLHGLANLRRIEDRFEAKANSSLDDLSGLEKLEYVGGRMDFEDNGISDISSLISLETVTGKLDLSDNDLTTLNGLSALTTMEDHLDVSKNDLVDIKGLTSLSAIGGSMRIFGNPNLEDISGLAGIGSMMKLVIDDRTYTTKPPADSAFCTALGNGNFDVVLEDGTVVVNSRVCQ